MPNEAGRYIGGILGLIGGFMAAKGQAESKQAEEALKNSRETLEKTVIGPAIEQGQPEMFDLHKATLQKYYPKQDLEVMRSKAETNTIEKKTQAMQKMIQALTGSTGGGAPTAPTTEQPTASPANAPAMLRGMPTDQPIGDMNVTGQPTSMEQVPRAYPVAQAQPQPTPQPAPAPQPQRIMPLQNKPQVTVGSKGEFSMNVTPHTEQEQQVHQAQFQGAIDWIKMNPHVQNALGPQITDRLRAGDPKALEQVIGLQKDPAVVPPVQDLLQAMDQIKDPKQYRMVMYQLFGDPKKAEEFMAMHPPGSSLNIKDIQGETQQEARMLAAKQGLPQEFITPDLARQAQNNVLQRNAQIRAETSAVTLSRMQQMFTARASTGAIVKTAEDLTKKLGEDTQAVAKAQLAMKYLAQAGDMLRQGVNTGVRPIDANMREFLGYMQSGKTGEAAALMQGWATDVAILEQRFFGASSRMAASIINKQEQNVPGVKDLPRVFNQKFSRLKEIFGEAEKHLGQRRESAVGMLDKNPYTKPAADAMRQGLYDVSTGFLKNLREQQANEPVPQVNFGTGEFGTSGGK